MKENRAFSRTRKFFLLKKADMLSTEFSWNPNSKCDEVPQSFISRHPFSDVFCLSKTSQPPG